MKISVNSFDYLLLISATWFSKHSSSALYTSWSFGRCFWTSQIIYFIYFRPDFSFVQFILFTFVNFAFPLETPSLHILRKLQKISDISIGNMRTNKLNALSLLLSTSGLVSAQYIAPTPTTSGYSPATVSGRPTPNDMGAPKVVAAQVKSDAHSAIEAFAGAVTASAGNSTTQSSRETAQLFQNIVKGGKIASFASCHFYSRMSSLISHHGFASCSDCLSIEPKHWL